MKISDNLSEQEIEVLLENFYQYFETGYILRIFKGVFIKNRIR